MGAGAGGLKDRGNRLGEINSVEAHLASEVGFEKRAELSLSGHARVIRGLPRGTGNHTLEGIGIGEKLGFEFLYRNTNMTKAGLFVRQTRDRSGRFVEKLENKLQARVVIQIHQNEAGPVEAIPECFQKLWHLANQFLPIFHIAHIEAATLKMLVEDLVPELKVGWALDSDTDGHGMPPRVPCSQSSPI